MVARAMAAGAGFLATGRRITVVDETIAKIATGMMKYPCKERVDTCMNDVPWSYSAAE